MGEAVIELRKQITTQEGEVLLLAYRLLEDEILLEGERVRSFGISIAEGRGESCAVADISSDRKAVEQLLETLWQMEVTPITLEDIVQDYIEN